MLDSLHRSYRLSLEGERLPPCWLRRHQSKPDSDDAPTAGLFRVGPAGRLRQELLATVSGAKEVVLLASFLLADRDLAKALLSAATSGKRVYVLTASEHRLAALPRDLDDVEPAMVQEHKRLLDELAGRVLLRSAEHFHAKFLVVDPHTSPRGFLSTANFNLALRDNVELGVALGPEAAQALAGWFAWAFWLEAERELVGQGRLAGVGRPPAMPPEPNHPGLLVTTKSHAILGGEALRLISDARRDVLVSSYGLSLAHPVVAALVDKARCGVPVTVLTRPRPAVSEAVQALAAAGARVFAHDKLHAKAIASERGAMVMTANLEAQGLDQGFEVGARLDAKAAASLRAVMGEWADRFPWQFAAAARRGEHLGEVRFMDRGLRDASGEVIEEQQIKLAPVTAESALALDAMPPPQLKPPEAERQFPRSVTFQWDVVAPRLPKKAKERKCSVERETDDKDGKPITIRVQEPYEPPVYEHAGKLYVLLRSQADCEAARLLAASLGATVVVEP